MNTATNLTDDVHHCCKSGHIHTGTPAGSITQIAGIDTYVTKHKNSNGRAVLYVHDALGLPFINNQLLADTYAEQAEVDVYLPDFLEGDSVPVSVLSSPGSFDFGPWLARHSRDHCSDMILGFAKELRDSYGVKKLAAVGFCWGGWGASMLGSTDLVDAIVVHHPTLLRVPEDIEKLKKPSLFLCAETDAVFPDSMRIAAQKILEEKKDQISIFKLYPGTRHGFAVRGGNEDVVVLKAAEDAKNNAVQFFRTHLTEEINQ